MQILQPFNYANRTFIPGEEAQLCAVAPQNRLNEFYNLGYTDEVFTSSVPSVPASVDSVIADVKQMATNAMQRANNAMSKANTADSKAQDALTRDMIPGHTPTNEELIAIVTPLIPAPIKGDPGKDGANATTTAAATQSANGLQSKEDKIKLDSLDVNLKKAHEETLPAILLGGTYNFDVSVPGALPSMTSAVNCTTSLGFGTVLEPVTGIDKVTIYIKAGLAIAAGKKTFNVRVIK